MPAPRRSLAVLATHVRARHTSASDGFSIPAGWMVMWPVTPSHTSYGVYTDPARFDPDRFLFDLGRPVVRAAATP